jgi:hypothetical protein
MAAATLNDVMRLAADLPTDEKEMLIEALKRQRAEQWRKELARDARKAVKDFRSGKLKPEKAADYVARRRAEWARMIRELVESPRFVRALRKYTARDRSRQECAAMIVAPSSLSKSKVAAAN